MPLNPSKFLHFESWKQLRQWLPEATESQLMTVFVWAGDLKPPPGDVHWVSEIRNAAFELLVERTRERLSGFLMQRCHCSDAHLVEDLIQQALIKLYLRGEQFDFLFFRERRSLRRVRDCHGGCAKCRSENFGSHQAAPARVRRRACARKRAYLQVKSASARSAILSGKAGQF